MVVLCFTRLLFSRALLPLLVSHAAFWLMQVLAVMHSVCILMLRPRRYLPCWVMEAPQELLLYR